MLLHSHTIVPLKLVLPHILLRMITYKGALVHGVETSRMSVAGLLNITLCHPVILRGVVKVACMFILVDWTCVCADTTARGQREIVLTVIYWQLILPTIEPAWCDVSPRRCGVSLYRWVLWIPPIGVIIGICRMFHLRRFVISFECVPCVQICRMMHCGHGVTITSSS